jgi:hypothetical protein
MAPQSCRKNNRTDNTLLYNPGPITLSVLLEADAHASRVESLQLAKIHQQHCTSSAALSKYVKSTNVSPFLPTPIALPSFMPHLLIAAAAAAANQSPDRCLCSKLPPLFSTPQYLLLLCTNSQHTGVTKNAPKTLQPSCVSSDPTSVAPTAHPQATLQSSSVASRTSRQQHLQAEEETDTNTGCFPAAESASATGSLPVHQ